MSFQNNNAWPPNCSSSMINGEVVYGTSTRMDNKRGHQWFVDASEGGQFFNKKQAIESLKEASGRAVMDNSLWLDGSISQSECPTDDRLFNLKPVVQASGFLDENIIRSAVSPPVDTENNAFMHPTATDSSISLTMSHAMGDPLCLNTGYTKAKVNERRMPGSFLPEFVVNSSQGEKDKAISTAYLNQRTADNMIPLPTYNIAEGNAISVNPSFVKMDKNFMSVAQASGKRDSNFVLLNPIYSGIGHSALSIGQTFNRGSYNVNRMGGQYEKENGSFASIAAPTYNKSYEDFVPVDPYYERAKELVSTGSTYGGAQRNIMFRNDRDASASSLGAFYDKENTSLLSMVGNLGKGDETTISFGSFQDKSEDADSYSRLLSRYDPQLNQTTIHAPVALRLQDSTEQQNANLTQTANSTSKAASKTDGIQKNKEPKQKKASASNFPSNVKSLLSTGIFDGVPVKYVSWSREKNLRGVVKGTGYLCSCPDCKMTKIINAYEFERHSGCKTKHPNNHIYFENGKTIYAVVQELKNTPQEMLFDAIQNVTGSPINQKNFNAWKASYKAATQELQRIYGNDMAAPPPS